VIPSFIRRLRRGRPIIVVSGLPRSGTSMAMRMLRAGGLPLLTDALRPADASNPHGYFEFEPVKALRAGSEPDWLPAARGTAVKIVSFLITHLPESYDYRVVFMRRDLDEVLASQDAMLDARGEVRGADSGRTRGLYADHLAQVERFLARRSCFQVLMVEHGRVLADPKGEAMRIATFVGEGLDPDAMAGAVDSRLYRAQKTGPRPVP
jgi:hypothetical protein